jgi:hypothetical protein
MILWVIQILGGPYMATAPEVIVHILLFDSWCCLMIASVVAKIQDIGVY